MLTDKANDFIDTVLSYVNYSFDRKKIRLELASHLSDKIDLYLNSGNVNESAEDLAIRDMGNAREIGEGLNKLHKPFLGLILKNSKVLAMIIVMIISCITSFNVGNNYNRLQGIERDTSTYISNMYFEINSTTHLLKSVEYWGDSINSLDHTENPFSQLLFRLNTMKTLSQSASSYIGYTEGLSRLGNITDSFDIIYQSIGGGVSYNDQLLCYDFLKDGVLSEKEIMFLIALKADLGVIQDRLIYNETKEYNFDIPLEEFAKMINPFINKYNSSNLTGIGLSN